MQIVEKLQVEKVEFIHKLSESSWKQLGVRFYDPDKNSIEIGKLLEYLIFRLHRRGNSINEISKIRSIDREFIDKTISKLDKYDIDIEK